MVGIETEAVLMTTAPTPTYAAAFERRMASVSGWSDASIALAIRAA